MELAQPEPESEHPEPESSMGRVTFNKVAWLLVIAGAVFGIYQWANYDKQPAASFEEVRKSEQSREALKDACREMVNVPRSQLSTREQRVADNCMSILDQRGREK